MGTPAVLVAIVIVAAIILFITELLSVDLVALLILTSLVLLGVITPDEGVAGFSNSATLTVAFMFVLSGALLKTGALQKLGPKLAVLFRWNFNFGLFIMMALVGIASAFINNTPIVAMLLPVILQVSKSTKISSSKMLIPLSYATILGGTCSLVGTSTNILVSGIAKEFGVGEFTMFKQAPIGIIFLAIGIVYMLLIGKRLLPDRSNGGALDEKFGLRDYITEFTIIKGTVSDGVTIMDSNLVRELDMDVLEIRRGEERFIQPAGDQKMIAGDILKVRCNVEKFKELKELANVNLNRDFNIGDQNLASKDTAFVEMIITANSEFEGKTLKDIDFRRSYRAVPLAIMHKEEILHEHLHETKLSAGDIVLAEVKKHHLEQLKNTEKQKNNPFIILSEEGIVDFDKRRFAIVISTIIAVIILATLELVPILIGSIAGSSILVLTKCFSMQEMYESIEWKVIFLLAGSLSLGVAMKKSGLADNIAGGIIENLGEYGPIAILSGLYLVTSILTEIMSNNATAALLAPIAIVTGQTLHLDPTPFLIAIMFGASASFMTPIGYQTNTMVYTAGNYKFMDFVKVGTAMNILMWIAATIAIPYFFPFKAI